MTSSPVITIDNLQMRFKGCEALAGINLTVDSGNVFALLGENGAGKSTLIRILTGFLRATSGSCRVLGLDPRTEATEIRRKIGYVADSPTMYEWMEVDEIGWFSAGFYPDGYLENYRERIAKYHLPPRQKIRSLSKGQRGKVALSLALAHEPELLILDEPTSGLDPLVRREFLESMVDLAASGRTVLLSSHLLSEVERVADQVAILHRGRICISGNVAELRDTICEVTVKLTDPLATLPSLAPPASVLVEQTNGRQRRMLIRHFDESSESILRDSHSVFDVTQRPAGLEDLFVACTRDAVDEISLAPAEAIEVKS